MPWCPDAACSCSTQAPVCRSSIHSSPFHSYKTQSRCIAQIQSSSMQHQYAAIVRSSSTQAHCAVPARSSSVPLPVPRSCPQHHRQLQYAGPAGNSKCAVPIRNPCLQLQSAGSSVQAAARRLQHAGSIQYAASVRSSTVHSSNGQLSAQLQCAVPRGLQVSPWSGLRSGSRNGSLNLSLNCRANFKRF